jgi:hypothetical protein
MRWRLKRTARLILVCATFALCLGATATAQMSQEDSQRTLIGLDMNRTAEVNFRKAAVAMPAAGPKQRTIGGSSPSAAPLP